MDSEGRMSKILVRKSQHSLTLSFYQPLPSLGSQSGDVHPVTFDNNNTRYDNAQLLWKLSSS